MPPPPLNPISHIGRAPFPPRPPPLCTKFSTHVPHNMPHPSTVQGLATPNPRGLGAQGKAVSPPSLWPASALPGLQKELESEYCHSKHTAVTASTRAIHRHQDHPIRTTGAQVMARNVSGMSARVTLKVKEGQQAGYFEPAQHKHIPRKPVIRALQCAQYHPLALSIDGDMAWGSWVSARLAPPP